MELGFELLDHLLDLLELALRLRSRALGLLIGVEELLDGAVEVREVEPHRRHEKRAVEDDREQSPPHRAAAHLVQQAVVLLREAVDLFKKRLMAGGHSRKD